MSGALHEGQTILLCTHYLDDVEPFLDRALILHAGRIAGDLLLDDLHAGGETLLERMAALCGWDPRHYLEFDAGRDGE